MEPKKLKSRQVSLQLFEFKPNARKYIRIETLYYIISEEDSIEKIFKCVSHNHDKKNKMYMLTAKNLEGVDMEFYMIRTKEDGNIGKIVNVIPDTVII
jgi:hypothetical protein